MPDFNMHPKKCLSMFMANKLLVELLKCLEDAGMSVFVTSEWRDAAKDFERLGEGLYGKDLTKRPGFNPLQVKIAMQMANAALKLSDAAVAAATSHPDHPHVTSLKYMQNVAATTLIDFFPGFRLPDGEVPDEFWARATKIRSLLLEAAGWDEDKELTNEQDHDTIWPC